MAFTGAGSLCSCICVCRAYDVRYHVLGGRQAPKSRGAGGGDSQQRRPGRPARLSRAQILAAALELADRDGLEAVTMQRIARAIGAEPMSLYRHVRNKEDLLDGLVDLVFAEIELPHLTIRGGGDAPPGGLRSRGAGPPPVGDRPDGVEDASRLGDAGLPRRAPREPVLAGFSARSGTRVTNIVDSYVYGFALQEKTLPVSTPEELAALGLEILAGYAGRYPHLETAARAHRFGLPLRRRVRAGPGPDPRRLERGR